MEKELLLYAGTYGDADTGRIQVYRIDGRTGSLEAVCRGHGVSNPSYLAVSSDGCHVYGVMEDLEYQGGFGGGAAGFRWEKGGLRLLNTGGTGGLHPCHILIDEERGYLFTANYSSGSISMFSLKEDGGIGTRCDLIQHEGKGPNEKRQEGPHVHFIGFSKDREGIWCADLGLDLIKYYHIDHEKSRLVSREERDIVMPPGSGPRHFVLDMNHKDIMYAVCELSSQVMVIDTGRYPHTVIQTISTLPEGAGENTCAAIKLSGDGRFLYASNRGDDSIAVFGVEYGETQPLSLVEIVKSQGAAPRDICLKGEWLWAANQDSDSITGFHRDIKSGRLQYHGRMADCISPVCLV